MPMSTRLTCLAEIGCFPRRYFLFQLNRDFAGLVMVADAVDDARQL